MWDFVMLGGIMVMTFGLGLYYGARWGVSRTLTALSNGSLRRALEHSLRQNATRD